MMPIFRENRLTLSAIASLQMIRRCKAGNQIPVELFVPAAESLLRRNFPEQALMLMERIISSDWKLVGEIYGHIFDLYCRNISDMDKLKRICDTEFMVNGTSYWYLTNCGHHAYA